MIEGLDLLSAMQRGGRFVLNRRGFDSRTVTTGAGRLHAYDARGDGALPTMVVLHGLGSAATAFGPLLSRLRPHARRVVALDLPGHGFSLPPDGRLTPEGLFGAVAEALDALVNEPMVLIASSMGGAIALRYAIDRPGRLASLALVSPAGARLDRVEWDELMHLFAIDDAAKALRLLGRLYHRAPWYLPALAPGFRDVMRRPAIRQLLEVSAPEDLPAPERLTALAMPILLLWGQSERLLPRSALDYYRRHLPGHALIEEPASFGHCPHFEDPRRLAARLVEFARGTTAVLAPVPGS
jgi:pimeloyl-ACP methyl ester carboxylesterase